MSGGGLVRAAGGVLARRDPAGAIEVVLVHRPRYDDWSFPKGKCEAGESDEDCARREVREETGMVARLVVPLPDIHYVDGRGRPKVVRYWTMEVVSDPGFVPGDETDQLVWLGLPEARQLLSYGHDRSLLDTANSALTGTS
jgi:8-oxo-dGTP pyrophosphatase MutT (NUDIX family)